MDYLKVNLWGQEIGRLVWDPAKRRTYFMYNPGYRGEMPDIAPLLSPAGRRNIHLPVYGDDRPIYQGLPPFIADSLPDSWGNTLFDRWVKDNRIPRNKITPLYKLMFIGTRGMGALEYEPCAADLAATRPVDIKSLYDMSLKVLDERDSVMIDGNKTLTLQALLAVGTSAGGRQMKAIISINDKTGEIRSGQTVCPPGFGYCILKFGDDSMPVAEIETACHRMAVSAGIDMEECRLLPVEGTSHFLTRRFDRKNGEKLYVQTLAAINPEARSYEDLIATCRRLSVTEGGIRQVFARLVFNVMANNTDDHNKNFSFILEKEGGWRIAPAYDITFIFNTNGTGPNTVRRLSVRGKMTDITKSDLLDFARDNGIADADRTIDRVAKAIVKFNGYAEEYGIGQPWRGIIQKTLNDNLSAFGYHDAYDDSDSSFRDEYGRTVTGFAVSVNSKGHYVVTADIDGHRQRRFVRPNMAVYSELSVAGLPQAGKSRLAGILFPPDRRQACGE